MDDISSQIRELIKNIENGKEYLDSTPIRNEIDELEKTSSQEGFWDNPQESQKVLQSLSVKKKIVEEYEALINEGNDLQALLEMYLEENNGELNENATKELQLNYQNTEKKYKQAYVSLFLNGKYDQGGALLSLSAGTGGTDAQDFTEMLLRMYLRFAERKGFKTNIYEKTVGSEAGIKSITIEITGEMVYGYLKAEKGIHRLIRLSPFNAKNLRQTSFAMVEVLPIIESDELPEIPASDLEIETFRASGAGGQHVNTTDSAVRITHKPTGFVVQCQNERSQMQNRQQAMKVLYGKLMEKKQKEEEEQERKLRGEHKEADFGNQIRTYTLHPYKLVKDHRTNTETGNVDAVLDGDLDMFIEAWLMAQNPKS